MLLNLNFNIKHIPLRNVRYFCCHLKKLLFTDKHEWISVENNIGTVGISNYAQEKLGDIVYVHLPEIGSKVSQHDECGAVESVKAASEIFSPVSGEITEVNKLLESKSDLINSHPYGDGWIFKINLLKTDELKSLMDEKAYNKFLEEDH